jgi:hypothetical protein
MITRGPRLAALASASPVTTAHHPHGIDPPHRKRCRDHQIIVFAVTLETAVPPLTHGDLEGLELADERFAEPSRCAGAPFREL